jgi:hypothetical protein
MLVACCDKKSNTVNWSTLKEKKTCSLRNRVIVCRQVNRNRLEKLREVVPVELCPNLSLGCLTPTILDSFNQWKLCKVPFFAMIRLREGDFAYDQDELDVMKQDIILLKGICLRWNPSSRSSRHRSTSILSIDRQACLRWIRSALHHYHAIFTSKSSFIIWPFRLLLKLNKLLRM